MRSAYGRSGSQTIVTTGTPPRLPGCGTGGVRGSGRTADTHRPIGRHPGRVRMAVVPIPDPIEHALYLPPLAAPRRTIGARSFDFSRQVAVMAIVNRTPDSFH